MDQWWRKMRLLAGFLILTLWLDSCFCSMWIAMREPAAYRRHLENSQSAREKACLLRCNDTCPIRLPGVGCKWRCKHKCRFKIYTLRKVKRKGTISFPITSTTLTSSSTTPFPTRGTLTENPVTLSVPSPRIFVPKTVTVTWNGDLGLLHLWPVADHSALQMAPALEERVTLVGVRIDQTPTVSGYVYHPPVWS